MLEMIEQPTAKKRAQTLMVSLVRKVWPNRQKRLVAWRPSSTELWIQHNNEYWFGTSQVGADDGVHRHWNSFGVYRRAGNLSISVEINIPIEDNTRRISGFFARDRDSEILYLMHDGGIGGGRKGIGRDAFMEAANARPQKVQTSTGVRIGLIVAPLEAHHFEAGVSSYLCNVIDFKAAVAEGHSPQAIQGLPADTGYAEYYREFSGAKTGGGDRFTYESRHGDIVHALLDWVPSQGIVGKIQKSVLVDLAVRHHGELVTVFEVKSSTDRQSLYTAIGQLMVHSANAEGVQRYLVIPAGRIPDDIGGCLAALSIRVIRYEIDGRVISFSN